jgi:hypothetical protein
LVALGLALDLAADNNLKVPAIGDLGLGLAKTAAVATS